MASRSPTGTWCTSARRSWRKPSRRCHGRSCGAEREAARDVTIGDGVTNYAIGSLPDLDRRVFAGRRRRPATYRDFRDFTLLSENLDAYAIGNPVVQPQELPVEVMPVLWNRNNAVRMTKPACCWYATSFPVAEEGLEVLRLAAGGLEELRAAEPLGDHHLPRQRAAVGQERDRGAGAWPRQGFPSTSCRCPFSAPCTR